MPKQETVSLTPELEAFQRQVDEFVYNQIQNQKQLLQEGRRGHFYINDLIANTPLVSSDILKNIINKEQEKQFSKQDLDEVKKSFNFMRERLNGFPAKKRFYILETMDLFSSQVNIGKLIPALLLLDGNDLKKAVCEFIKPSFTSINKNIETLVSTTKLFSPKTMHIDMGSLYSFSGELASVLLRLFKPSFLNQFNDISSSIELLLTVIQAGSPCHSPTQKKPVYLEMLDDKNKIRRIILEFIVKMQSHDALLTYAFKRNGYYKHFLASVTNPDRFKGIEPLYISRIFAGCLVSNKQLMPEESLIDGMLDPELFNNPILLKQRIQFIDKLAPSTVNKLITDIRLHLQEFSKKSMAKEFHQVNSLSVITVLKKIWSGFVRFIDKNIETVVKPVKFAFEQI
ncbi:MAG: hypothetical protein OEY59_12125, partial [Deltaproteobacteria bacterium]|nr:hypothetical protein [Deltaproteobacteria bacterium]